MATPEVQPPGTPAAHSPLAWVVAITAIALMSCLCGLSAGSILVSAGVSAYAGLTGVEVTAVAGVPPASLEPLGDAPTLFPTYTFQPTYTLLPTYTFAPTLSPTDTLFPSPTDSPPTATVPAGPGTLDEDILHIVEPDETLESIAELYGVTDLVPAIYVNELDPLDPQVAEGDEVVLPADVSEYCINPTEPVLAELVRVEDGDTIVVSIGGQEYTIDYIGVNAPEIGDDPEPFAYDALNYNQDLVTGEVLTLMEDVTNAGTGGTLPRYVFAGSTFVNYEMTRSGFAVAEPAPPDQACDDLFDLAAAIAADEGRGLWEEGASAQVQPVTPSAISTQLSSGWTPPPTLTATSTSSLGFTCHCNKNGAWGNFSTVAQRDSCRAICEIAAARQTAACATAAAQDGVSPSQAGCE